MFLVRKVRLMAIRPQFEYEPPKIKTRDINTPVYFYTQNSTGPEPGTDKGDQLFWCLAEVYDPSSKDLAILDSHSVNEGVTINIPDPLGEYLPSTNHLVEIDDYRYQGQDGKSKTWNIVEVSHDFHDSRFIKIILGRDGS